MENILVEFKLIFIIFAAVVLNFVCDYFLSVRRKDEPLSNWTMMPPLGIIALFIYPFQKKRQLKDAVREWALEHMEMTTTEYDYMMKHITNDELEQLFTPPKTWRDKKKILQIRDKYTEMYQKDFFNIANEHFNNK